MNNKEWFDYYLTLNINTICRICLEKPTESEKFTPIFDSLNKSTNFSCLIMACAAIQVTENDGLPNHLCNECVSQLQIAYQFKIKCEQSDVRLREYLDNSVTNTTTIAQEQNSNYTLNDVTTTNGIKINGSQNVFSILTTIPPNTPVLSLTSDNLNTNSIILEPNERNESNTTNLNELKFENKSSINSVPANYMFKSNFVINIENIPNHIDSKSIIAISNFEQNEKDVTTFTNLHQLNSVMGPVTINATEPIAIDASEIHADTLIPETIYLEPKKENQLQSNNNKADSKLNESNNDNDLTNEFIILHKNSKNKDKKTLNFQLEKENQQVEIYEISTEPTISDVKISKSNIKLENNKVILNSHNNSKIRSNNKKRMIYKQQNQFLSKLPKKHQCDTCGKIFKAKQGLIQHLRIHSGERPYLCHLCNKRFINGGHLHTHMRTHTGEKNHKCLQCTKAFATAQQLQKHIIAIHTQERPYQCSYCPKRCASSSNLTTHIRIHTGEKNYHCDRCPKAFSTKGQLLQHILIHTGQKPFLCEYCQKRFTQRAHLTRHTRMHKD